MSLSTHVLDTMHGCPAAGVRLSLSHEGQVLFEGVTDADGRCPDVRALTIPAGRYSLQFHAGIISARVA